MKRPKNLVFWRFFASLRMTTYSWETLSELSGTKITVSTQDRADDFYISQIIGAQPQPGGGAYVPGMCTHGVETRFTPFCIYYIQPITVKRNRVQAAEQLMVCPLRSAAGTALITAQQGIAHGESHLVSD